MNAIGTRNKAKYLILILTENNPGSSSYPVSIVRPCFSTYFFVQITGDNQAMNTGSSVKSTKL